jgi:uncharacterized membrane protein
MDWAYFHILINHFPIVGVIIGALLLIAGLVFKNQGVNQGGLGIIVFSTLTAVLAYQTGDPARDVLKGLPDVAESLINRHEDIATIGMYLMIPAGLLAAMSFYSVWKKERSARFLVILTLVLSMICSVVMVYVGQTGGQIRHSEFRNDVSKQYIIDHQHK